VFVGGVVDGPELFKGESFAAVKIGRAFVDAIELGNVEEAVGVGFVGGADIETGFCGVVGGGRMAGFAIFPVEDGAAVFLRRIELAIAGEMAIGRERNGFDEGDEIGELRGIETFGMEKIFGDARAALRFEIGIVTVPFEGSGFGDAAEGPIGNAIAAELRRFEIPGDAVDVIVGMAGGAGELSLEAEAGVVEEAFAAAELRSGLAGTAEIDFGLDALVREVDDGDAVVETIGDVGELAVGRDDYCGGIRFSGKAANDEFAGGVKAIGELAGRYGVDAMLELGGVEDGEGVGFGGSDEDVAAVGSEGYAVGAGVVGVDVVD